jgi:hypothetical protein
MTAADLPRSSSI